MSWPPPPLPPPLTSACRVGLPHPPSVTLDGSDGDVMEAAGIEEENRAEVAYREEPLGPFSQSVGAGAGSSQGRPAAALGRGAGGLGRGAAGHGSAADGLPRTTTGHGIVPGGMVKKLAGRGRGAAAQASGTGGMDRLAAGRGRCTPAQGSTLGLSMDADELGGGMIGAFETDPAIGDAFLASQASGTSGAQRRKRAASTKDEV
jgi:hypothetical protein